MGDSSNIKINKTQINFAFPANPTHFPANPTYFPFHLILLSIVRVNN